VDPNSPAEAAGLRARDRIIEVNGVNVMEDLHPAVVSKIKMHPSEVKMFVAVDETERYYKSQGIVTNSDMYGVRYIECPRTNPNSTHSGEESAV